MSRRHAPGRFAERLERRTLLSTYFVSPAGSDAGRGTSASAAWRTLQVAADRARAGDIVRVAAGTYAEGMNLYGKGGGTKAAPIQFLADPGAVITHAATAGVNASDAAINIESTGGWYVIRGFTVRGDGSMSKAGIRVAASDHVQLLDNTVDGAFTGIFVSFSEGVAVVGNTCRNATDQHGIYVSEGTRWTLVRGNTLVGNNWDGLHLNASIEDPNDGAVVEANVVHDNRLSGMDVEGASDATFRNNVIYDNGKHGITVHSQDQADTPRAAGNTFVNNTIAGNALFAIQFGPEDTRGEVVFNNVLLSASTGNYGAIGVSGVPVGLASDHNVVADSFSTTLGDGHVSLAGWRSATGQDANSIVADAAGLFVNAAAGDYRPRAAARTVDTGSAGVAGRPPPSTDRAGASRPKGRAWDVGAYEYQAATPARTPFGGSALPVGTSAVVEFENYDKGAEGTTYHDTDAANLGKAYRTDGGVDVQPVPGGGYAVGFAKAGEWTEYTINVAQTGTYNLTLVYASLKGGGRFHLEIDGKAVTPVTALKSTGDWQEYQGLALKRIAMSAGQHVLRLAVDGNDSTGYVANFDRVQFSRVAARTPFKGSLFAPNQRIEAEDFDVGGEGVAYHDTDAQNVGRVYRPTEGVDAQPAGDTGEGFDVGFARAGEWLAYSLNVPTAGAFGLQVRLASLKGGGKFHFEIDGKTVASFTAPNTGNWQKYVTVSSAKNISLSAGQHALRLVMDGNDSTGYVANFNWMKVVS